MKIIKGIPASRGDAGGTARVVTSPDEFMQFLEGEILIAKMTSPEWVPLFEKAVAVVTEQGGLLCHAAIVSREMQLPCVVGVVGALSSIKTGTKIKVFGSTGEVHILNQD